MSDLTNESLYSPEKSPMFAIGQLVSKIEQLDRRIERYEDQTSERLDRIERSFEKQLTDFAVSLRTIAEGYVRREEINKVNKDIDSIGNIVRDQQKNVDSLNLSVGLLTEKQVPINAAFWAVIKWGSVMLASGLVGGKLFHLAGLFS